MRERDRERERERMKTYRGKRRWLMFKYDVFAFRRRWLARARADSDFPPKGRADGRGGIIRSGAKCGGHFFQRRFTLDSRGRAKRETLKKSDPTISSRRPPFCAVYEEWTPFRPPTPDQRQWRKTRCKLVPPLTSLLLMGLRSTLWFIPSSSA